MAAAALFIGISPAFLSGYCPRTAMPADPDAWLSDADAGVAWGPDPRSAAAVATAADLRFPNAFASCKTS